MDSAGDPAARSGSMRAMADVVDVLNRYGGCARFGQLRTSVSARHIRAALTAGHIERIAKGLYRLPAQKDAVTVARSQGGVVSHLSAALLHGLTVVNRPQSIHVTVPRGQHPRRSSLPCTLHWADDVQSLADVTTVTRTVLDCARTLPFSEALAVADSALRTTDLVRDDLDAAVVKLRGPNRRRAQRVAEFADARSESPLESMLRAILIEAGISGFVPQVEIDDEGFVARIDLAHPTLRIAIEADSFEHHGTRRALVRDCRRHVNLTIRGWRLLRFSWEDVMYDPEWVVATVRTVVGGTPGHHNALHADTPEAA